MPGSHRSTAFTLAVVFAATPLAFGLIRFVRTGSDLRYLWIALASLAGAAAVSTARRRPRGQLVPAVAQSAAAFLFATLLAVALGLLLGTSLNPGLLVVAGSFGLCYAASSLCYALGR